LLQFPYQVTNKVNAVNHCFFKIRNRHWNKINTHAHKFIFNIHTQTHKSIYHLQTENNIIRTVVVSVSVYTSLSLHKCKQNTHKHLQCHLSVCPFSCSHKHKHSHKNKNTSKHTKTQIQTKTKNKWLFFSWPWKCGNNWENNNRITSAFFILFVFSDYLHFLSYFSLSYISLIFSYLSELCNLMRSMFLFYYLFCKYFLFLFLLTSVAS
jgi:hypothetical protein